jgi:hypothetical protein
MKNKAIVEYLVDNETKIKEAIKKAAISLKNAMHKAYDNDKEFDADEVEKRIELTDGVYIVVSIDYNANYYWINVGLRNLTNSFYINSADLDLWYMNENPEDDKPIRRQVDKMYPIMVGKVALDDGTTFDLD